MSLDRTLYNFTNQRTISAETTHRGIAVISRSTISFIVQKNRFLWTSRHDLNILKRNLRITTANQWELANNTSHIGVNTIIDNLDVVWRTQAFYHSRRIIRIHSTKRTANINLLRSFGYFSIRFLHIVSNANAYLVLSHSIFISGNNSRTHKATNRSRYMNFSGRRNIGFLGTQINRTRSLWLCKSQIQISRRRIIHMVTPCITGNATNIILINSIFLHGFSNLEIRYRRVRYF